MRLCRYKSHAPVKRAVCSSMPPSAPTPTSALRCGRTSTAICAAKSIPTRRPDSDRVVPPARPIQPPRPPLFLTPGARRAADRAGQSRRPAGGPGRSGSAPTRRSDDTSPHAGPHPHRSRRRRPAHHTRATPAPAPRPTAGTGGTGGAGSTAGGTAPSPTAGTGGTGGAGSTAGGPISPRPTAGTGGTGGAGSTAGFDEPALSEPPKPGLRHHQPRRPNVAAADFISCLFSLRSLQPLRLCVSYDSGLILPSA